MLMTAAAFFAAAVCGAEPADGCVKASGAEAPKSVKLTFRGLTPADSRDGLANPERGWRFETGVGITPADPVRFDYLRDLWPFPRYRKDGVTVTQAYCYLSRFCDGPVAQDKLDALQASFDRARADGVKLLLRFAYEFDGLAEGPTGDRVLEHVRQLTPVVRKNIDVIYCLQIGWIGLWGEFHTSIHGLERDPELVGKVLAATLEMLPEGRFTMMRRMAYRHMALKALGDDREIDATTAFTSAPHARVGFFNDATLANWHDGATFPAIEPYAAAGHPEFDEVAREGRWMPVDGELFWTEDKGRSDPVYADALRAIVRFRDHHYTTFSLVHGNSELDTTPRPWTIDFWKKTPVTAELLAAYGVDFDPDYFAGVPYRTGYEFIRDHLGYRLKLAAAEFEETSSGLKVTARLRNYGFAPPINPRRPVWVVVDAAGACTEHPVDFDCRTLQPGEERAFVATLPMLRADDRLALWFPAPETAIQYRAEYAVRLANAMDIGSVGGRLLHFLNPAILRP